MATAAAAVLVVLGTTILVLALVSQQHPPQPAPAAGSSTAPTSALPSTAPTSEPPTTEPPPATGPPPAVPLALPPSEPLAIDIPAIGVHSKVQYLGLASDGTLEVPAPGPLYNQAAWYRYSPTPGSLGPAIISGHVDSLKDGPSVFFRLGDLRPGDDVTVTRADGRAARFKVDAVRVYPKDRFPSQLVYGNTDHAALRLLTCGGPFDRASRHYVDNIIVFASLVSSTGEEAVSLTHDERSVPGHDSGDVVAYADHHVVPGDAGPHARLDQIPVALELVHHALRIGDDET
jgi:sortase (surface protein transpeptidase)